MKGTKKSECKSLNDGKLMINAFFCHSTQVSKLLSLPRNNKLGWKFAKETNTLAYYAKGSIWGIS
jgi:hypothetical protein